MNEYKAVRTNEQQQKSSEKKMYSNPVRLSHQDRDVTEMAFSDTVGGDEEMRVGRVQQYASQMTVAGSDYQNMVEEEINSRSRKLQHVGSTQSIRSSRSTKRRGRSQRKEKSQNRQNGSVSPSQQNLKPRIIDLQVQDNDSQILNHRKPYQSTTIPVKSTANAKVQNPSIIKADEQSTSSISHTPKLNPNVYSDIKLNAMSSTPDLNSTEKKLNFQQNIHYGANGKFIDVKNPFTANSNLSKFLKSPADGRNTGYHQNMQNIDHHLPTFSYLNTDHQFNSELQVSKFNLPTNENDNQIEKSPNLNDKYQSCLEQPQIYSQNHLQPSFLKQTLQPSIIQDYQLQVAQDDLAENQSQQDGLLSPEQQISMDRRSSKSKRSKRSKSRKGARRRVSKMSCEFGSSFDPDQVMMPVTTENMEEQDNILNYLTGGSSNFSNTESDQPAKTKSKSGRKRKGKSKRKGSKHAILQQFMMSPKGSAKLKNQKKLKNKSIVEMMQSDAEAIAEEQLASLLRSPCQQMTSNMELQQDQAFTFSKTKQSKSKSKKKHKHSRVTGSSFQNQEHETFGSVQKINALSLPGSSSSSQCADLMGPAANFDPSRLQSENLPDNIYNCFEQEKSETQVFQNDNDLLAFKNKKAVSNTGQNSPKVLELVPKKVELTKLRHEDMTVSQDTPQVLKQNKIVENIKTPRKDTKQSLCKAEITPAYDSGGEDKKQTIQTEYYTAYQSSPAKSGDDFNDFEDARGSFQQIPQQVMSHVSSHKVLMSPEKSSKLKINTKKQGSPKKNGLKKTLSTQILLHPIGQRKDLRKKSHKENLGKDELLKPITEMANYMDKMDNSPELLRKDKTPVLTVTPGKKGNHVKNKISSAKKPSSNKKNNNLIQQSPFNMKKAGTKVQASKTAKPSNNTKGFHSKTKSITNNQELSPNKMVQSTTAKLESSDYLDKTNISPMHADKLEMKRGSMPLSESQKINPSDLQNGMFHKRKNSNLQEYVRMRVGNITGSVLSQSGTSYVNKSATNQSQSKIQINPGVNSSVYSRKNLEQFQQYHTSKNKQSFEMSFNVSQRLGKKPGQQTLSSSGSVNFDNLKQLKTVSSQVLSGALSTANKLQTNNSSSSTGLKTTHQPVAKGKALKHNFFSSQEKGSSTGFQSGSLGEKETSYQRSKNSSNSDRMEKIIRFKDNISGRSSKEASLENIQEQDDDLIDLQISKEGTSEKNEQDVEFKKVDVIFQTNNNKYDKNQNQVATKQKMLDKKYTTTKNSMANTLMGSMAVKKMTQNAGYQIPIARKSQFRNKRPSDSNNLNSLKKQQFTQNSDILEASSPSKLNQELSKSGNKPGGTLTQSLMMAKQKTTRDRLRTQVRTSGALSSQIQNRSSTKLFDQLLQDRQKELKETLRAKIEQKPQQQPQKSSGFNSQSKNEQIVQNVKVRPGTSHKEHADMLAPRSQEKMKESIKSTADNGKNSIRGKKSSIVYSNNQNMQSKQTMAEKVTSGATRISQNLINSYAKAVPSRNTSQCTKQPSIKAMAASSQRNKIKEKASNMGAPSKHETFKNSSKVKTPITAAVGTSGKAGGPSKPSFQLLDSEKEKYGDRCPAGYKKLDLLGKGGIALVWLAESKNDRKKVALKQFPKSRGCSLDSSAKIEIETLSTLFPMELKDGCDGNKDSDYERGYGIDPDEFPGIRSIARLIDQIEEKNDFWLVYEVGAKSFGKLLTEVKGEFYKGERIYNVQHQNFYRAIARDSRILGTFIVKIAEIFDVLARFGIVHSDIKPDNILVQMNEYNTDISDIKLIDFGSAFQFHNVTQITATTPEYLAPEILDYLEQRNKNQKSNISSAVQLNKNSQPWSFDVWSLGTILVEIVTGFPVWMSLKCRVSTVTGKSVLGQGLLGVQGREGKRIMIKQQQVFKNIPQTLKKYECYGLDHDKHFMDLLSRMLDFNCANRISPQEIINHPFCQR